MKNLTSMFKKDTSIIKTLFCLFLPSIVLLFFFNQPLLAQKKLQPIALKVKKEIPKSPSASLLGSCARTSQVFKNAFGKQSFYIPVNGKTRPATVTKKVKIRFVVLEKNNTDNHQANFRPKDTPELHLMVLWLNNMMKDMARPQNPVRRLCGDCYIKDERIRVQLTGIDFINDTLQSHQGQYTDSILNIYLFVDSAKSKPEGKYPHYRWGGAWSHFGGRYMGPAKNSTLNIYMFNTYIAAKKYHLMIDTTTTYHDILWSETRRLMHELHHCLGLGHLQKNKRGNYGFDPGGCNGPDYLADAFPNGCPMSYGDDSTNNIMNTSDWSNYLSPLQIGRVHRTAFLGIMSQYMYPTETPDSHPWVIDSNQTWDFPIRMYQNIVIKKGQTLIITCKVQMPSNSKIIIEKGGHLILNSGTITSYNNRRTWLGLQFGTRLRKRYKRHPERFVTFKNGGQLKKVKK